MCRDQGRVQVGKLVKRGACDGSGSGRLGPCLMQIARPPACVPGHPLTSALSHACDCSPRTPLLPPQAAVRCCSSCMRATWSASCRGQAEEEAEEERVLERKAAAAGAGGVPAAAGEAVGVAGGAAVGVAGGGTAVQTWTTWGAAPC